MKLLDNNCITNDQCFVCQYNSLQSLEAIAYLYYRIPSLRIFCSHSWSNLKRILDYIGKFSITATVNIPISQYSQPQNSMVQYETLKCFIWNGMFCHWNPAEKAVISKTHRIAVIQWENTRYTCIQNTYTHIYIYIYMIANDIDIELQGLSRNPANCLISSSTSNEKNNRQHYKGIPFYFIY